MQALAEIEAEPAADAAVTNIAPPIAQLEDRTGSEPAIPVAAALDVALADLVNPLVDRLAATSGVVSVILLGSAARGELARADVDGRDELFSDLEFLVVTERRLTGKARRAVLADIERIAAGFGYTSPLFHVDILFREQARLGSLPPFIFTFELAAKGRTVHGPELRGAVRRVDLANLDRPNTREILMKRLWAIAAGLPAKWVRGEALDPVLARTLGVVLHRNPLDVTTVLLPEVGVLLPSYAERVRYWSEHPELAFRAAIDAGLGHDSSIYLADCLAERAEARPAADPDSAYAEAIRFISAALGWLGWPPDQAGRRGARGELFNPRPVTPGEWLAVVRQAVRIAYTLGPNHAARWASARRKDRLTAGLLDLHGALIAQQAGEAENARKRLDRSITTLRPVACPTDAFRIEHGAFAARWLAARALAGRAFWRTVRLGDPLAWGRIARAIAWDERRV